MKGFNANIEKDTLENNNFRKVLYTGKHSQLVLMSLKPQEKSVWKCTPITTNFSVLKPDRVNALLTAMNMTSATARLSWCRRRPA